ncbi:MAG: DUF4381 domain-containing protein [Acidiferrobacterales bacterium]|nr:DUF4381 domain-containing protein [Acidiferrobacterales bacterium]
MPSDAEQQQFADQLAQQLRGLDLPEPVSWWPLAIGWWVVIVLGLCLIAFLVFKLIKWQRKNRYRKFAQTEISKVYKDWQQTQNSLQYLHSSNAILKRVTRKFETGADSSSLGKSGNAWAETLQRYANKPLSDNTISALSTECYKAEPNVDINHVHQQIKAWLNHHRSPKNA